MYKEGKEGKSVVFIKKGVSYDVVNQNLIRNVLNN